MLVVPKEIRVRYAEFLTVRGVAQKHVNKCQKWLRYYLDFCNKYQYEIATSSGLEAFLLKLTEKQQSIESKQEAKRSVQLYQDFLNSTENHDRGSKIFEKDKRVPVVQKPHFKESEDRGVLPIKNPHIPETEHYKECGSSWEAEFAGFEDAIRMRHYSDKTLKSYGKYIRDFQKYTRSLDPDRLKAEHVKDYLTHLAVKKKVSASTQNLAFNSLLFFFQKRIEQRIRHHRWCRTRQEKTIHPGGIITGRNR